MTSYRMIEIPFETSRRFREQILSDAGLVTDEWDAHSEHWGLFRDDEIIATFRLVHPWNGQLPLSEHAPQLPVADDDLQVGRVATRRAGWDRAAGELFLRHYRENVITRGHRLYVAVPSTPPAIIPIRHYEKMNFRDTGARYHDARYGRSFHILERENGVSGGATAPRTAHDR